MSSRVSKLQSSLSSTKLQFKPERQIDSALMNDVDNHQPPTTFVEFFYTMCDGDFPTNTYGYSSPPTQSDFALAFFYSHHKDGHTLFEDKYKDAWIRRAQVSYPSLVRDMHFMYLLTEYAETTDTISTVEYDPQRDITDGVDAIVEYNNTTFFVNLYVDTQKSQNFLNRKKTSRHPSNDAIEVHLPLSLGDSRNITVTTSGNEFYLYSTQHIDELIEKMNTALK